MKIDLPRLLIVGCGDVGMRLLPLVQGRFRVFAVTEHTARHEQLRSAGAIPLTANLDQPHTLACLTGLARTIVHLAPPQKEGERDLRTRRLAAVLPSHARLVYISTSGVYGDCGGMPIDETQPIRPHTSRAKRRADAESVLRAWGKRSHSRVSILRVPGIYAADRMPLERLKKGTPVLMTQDDVYTNHIHADDLARLIALTLFRGRPGRIYNAVDDSEMRMGDYFDAIAKAYQLPLPPRATKAELQAILPPVSWSFMSESRRLGNRRMKDELGGRLQYPRVSDALQLLDQR